MLLLATTALTSPLLISAAQAQTLPTGGSVAAGSVAISQPSATQLNITQSSQSAVVNWQSFSLGQGSAVNIAQPNATSAILNRVTGSTPSTIAGQINANGQVYLVNPNGIAITRTGTVNTGGGFVASTLGISDSDFMSGKRAFTGNGASAGVSNAGSIRVGRGGYAALIGGTVSNSGSIDVPLGKVGLGSGERATLDFAGDGFLQVAMPTNAGGRGALIRSSGSIKAEGGSVTISAATAREAARNAINISGVVQARSISGHSGSITIGGGAGGNVKITGRLITTSRAGHGGTVAVTGRSIKLKGATVDASGKTGGGTINIGGGRQGTGPLQRAKTTSIDSATVIRADAMQSGNGGNVVVWSDQLTTFAGQIFARGGSLSGNGGEAEVSGKARLAYSGLADLSAVNGRFGNLLLDPYNVTISNGTGQTSAGFTAAGDDSVINVMTLQSALALANVTVTTGSGGSQDGNITVAAPLTWSSGSLLTLTAANAIAVNANIIVAGGGQLALNAGTTTVGSTTQPLLSFANGANVTFSSNANQGTQALTINSNAYTLLRSMADIDGIDGVAAIAGGTINTQAGGLSGHYALAGSLNATGTVYTDALVGTNSSQDSSTQFSGTFEGLGHTITGLSIAKVTSYAGLFGYSVGTIRDIGLIDGAVSARSFVGGLAGWNTGAIEQSYATGNVTGTTIGSYAGGLIGFNTGAVTQSYATGTVSGNSINDNSGGVGGLAGSSGGSITQSYATGSVSGASSVGGLLGRNFGSVTQSYATGAVHGSSARIGGLVGQNVGSVTQAYATGAVNGIIYVGGLVGLNSSSASVRQVYASGAVSGGDNGDGNVGGLVGWNAGSVTQAYATGAVTSVRPIVGGLIGLNTGSVTQAYWDTDTTGQSASAAGTPLTTRQLQGLDPVSGSTYFSTATNLGDGTTSAFSGGAAGLYPYLTNFFPGGVTAMSGFAYADRGVTPLASNASSAKYVTLDAGGLRTQVTTGANGYYYVLQPADTFTGSGTATLGTTSAGNAPGTVIGARLDSLSAATSGFDIWGNTLIAPTAATSLSAAPSTGAALFNSDGNAALAASAFGPNAPVSLLGLASAGYIATGSSGFAVDAAIGSGAVSGGLYAQTAQGPITVTAAQTLTGPTNLTLLSSGALAINAPITVNGAGTVTLAYDTSSPNNFAFGSGASLTYNNLDGTAATDVVAGQRLAVNGQNYTLIYNMAQLDAVDGYDATGGAATTSIATYGAGLSGNYALAGSLDASGTLFSAPLIAAKTTNTLDALDSPQFTGQFSGLGHAVDGLQISSANLFNAGLFGVIGVGGVVSDLGVTNANIFAGFNDGTVAAVNLGTVVRAFGSGEISVGIQINSGGLVGVNLGVIANSSATTHVFGGDNVGGLVGLNSGTIVASFATGNVENLSSNVGGLVGANTGSISDSYATGVVKGLSTTSGMTQLDSSGTGGLAGFSTGTITNSYATGEVSGYALVGGLVGWGAGSIVNSHATGNVTGLPYGVGSTTAQDVGGLVGQFTNPADTVVITNSYATGAVSGYGDNVGGLVGLLADAQVSGSYATGDVHGILTNVGGLFGFAGNSTIDTSYATGNVTSPNRFVGGLIGINVQTDISNSYATGSVSGFLYVGGLIGSVDFMYPAFGSSTISRSYATGAVTSSIGTAGGLVGISAVSGNLISQSYATGAVTSLGGRSVGGLVGFNSGAIENSYATGAVVNAGTATGGLVGFNVGTITSSYSTGAVANAGTLVGGFVGRNSGTIASGAYDVETSGRSTAIGVDFTNQGANVIGYTTAQLQHDGLPTGFSSAVWSGGRGGLYPYLTSLFSGGVQAVSGFAYADGGVTPLASGANGPAYVSIASNGQTRGSVTTGADGYYYYLAPAGGFGAAGVAAYMQTNMTTGATDAVSYASGTPGVVTGLDVSGGWRRDTAGASTTTLSALDADFATTIAGTPISGVSFTNRQINTSAAFAIDQALSVTDTLTLNARAAVTQSAAITTPKLLLTGTGGAFTLTHSGNAVDTLAANTGSVNVKSNSALTISAGIANAAGVTTPGVTTTGNASIAAAGNLTIAAGAAVTGANPVLATNGAFVNNAGTHAVTATSGRWLVYSADPANNVFGNLDSGNTAIWNAQPGTTVSPGGNRYAFAANRTLTVTSLSDSKIYGDDITLRLATDYTVNGFDAGLAGVYLADAAATAFTGSATVTSPGAAGTAIVAGSPYAITPSLGTLASSSGYSFAFINSGLLTVTPASARILPVAIDAASLASSVERDQFRSIVLPDDAKPVFGAPPFVTSLGNGVLYADPRFDGVFVCFGSGAPVCLVAR